MLDSLSKARQFGDITRSGIRSVEGEVRSGLLALAIAFALVLGCARGPGQPVPQHEPAPAAEGRSLFVAKGCAVCHGQNAEGTSIAPALPGHTKDQVIRQVRAPRFQMPAFSGVQVSDEELGKIADYIESLGPGAMVHMEPTAMPGLLAMHHWMAIMALDAHNVDEANHHIGHIIELVQEADHRRQTEEARDLLAQGQIHEAEHRVEGMLAGRAVFGLTLDRLHLELALVALEAKDTEDLKHHLQHFVGQAPHELTAKGEDLLRLLEGNRLDDLERELRELLGEPVERH